MGNGQQAIQLAEEVIENLLDEHAARAQYLIGKQYFQAGDYQKAFDELMRVTILYKTVTNYEEWAARARLLIAQCEVRLDRADDARRTLNEVIGNHPGDEFGAQAKQLLDEIDRS